MGTRITGADRVDMLGKVREIAGHLGEGWEARPGIWGNGEDAYLNGPDGEELHVRTGRAASTRGRVEIYGSIGDFKRYDEPRHEITVSPDKAAARVAGDITRRLLPGYREGLVLARKRKAEHEQAEADREHTITTLLGILPGAQRLPHKPDTVQFGRGKYGEGAIGGEARVVHGDVIEWTARTNGIRSSLALAELIASTARDKA
ncbi:hypothetical protein [Amycolatopsis lexingtonensis]|uniref:hypothetical protein n=1 Tax=Amycolatopsis lexingtonensis TaxID=218822 RepID=UPI003F714D47